MYPAVVWQCSFTCVAHLYVWIIGAAFIFNANGKNKPVYKGIFMIKKPALPAKNIFIAFS